MKLTKEQKEKLARNFAEETSISEKDSPFGVALPDAIKAFELLTISRSQKQISWSELIYPNFEKFISSKNINEENYNWSHIEFDAFMWKVAQLPVNKNLNRIENVVDGLQTAKEWDKIEIVLEYCEFYEMESEKIEYKLSRGIELNKKEKEFLK